jgi:hypothetical protein
MANNIGKLLIIFGIVILLIGTGLVVFSKFKIPFLGKLPGDFMIQRENFTFYFPLTSSIIISVILTIIFSLFSKK